MHEEEDDELMRICTNCNHFFPHQEDNFEKGVCLLDKDLEPYLDDIMEMEDLSHIADLIKRKLRDNEQDACENFDPVEFDPSDMEGESILYSIGEDADPEEIIAKIYEKDPLTRLKFISMDEHKKDLNSLDKNVKQMAIERIVNYAALGNFEAAEIFYQYYENLPPAETLEETHQRVYMLQYTRRLSGEERYARMLIKELYRTESNRTTRGLISEIFKILSRTSLKYIEEDLENMLDDSRFGYRLKQKIENILYGQYEYD
jgi:hypothetical protein